MNARCDFDVEQIVQAKCIDAIDAGPHSQWNINKVHILIGGIFMKIEDIFVDIPIACSCTQIIRSSRDPNWPGALSLSNQNIQLKLFWVN